MDPARCRLNRIPVPFEPAAWAPLAPLAAYRALLEKVARDQGGPAWPPVDKYRTLLGADVDFMIPKGRLPAGMDASDIDSSYIGYCAQGQVPSRPNNLHDFLNALTWTLFPLGKRALCQRQIQIARARGAPTNRVRTRAQDHLAMLDEGGLLLDPNQLPMIFGHALLEDEIRGRVSRGMQIPVISFADPHVAEVIAHLPLPDEPPVIAP